MMLPGQIKNYSIPTTKQGTYKASDVEAFRQKVYAAFCEVVSENTALKEKFVSLSDLVNEYNAGKNSIATALIKSQALADETVKNAQAKADEVIADAKGKADTYYNSKVQQADDYAAAKQQAADDCYLRAETELEKVLKEAEIKAQEYIAQINRKASEIIAAANEQASEIVARAYDDARKAREACDEIVASAKQSLPEIRGDVEGFKNQTKQLLSVISQAVDSITVPNDIAFSLPELEEEPPAVLLSEEEIEPFTMEDEPAEAEEPVESESFPAQPAEETAAEDADADRADASSATDYIFDKFSAFEDFFSSSDAYKKNNPDDGFEAQEDEPFYEEEPSDN